MKREFELLLILTVVFNLAHAQPIITNAEDFEIGTVLQFQRCDPSGVSAGNAGANQTWDFSTLTTLPDTTTEWMVSPASTTHGASFPAANLVVKVSNGQFTYMDKSVSENNIVGFIDTTAALPPTHYPNPMLIAARPLDYGTVVTDTFTITGSPALGVVTIDPDAYGTLILPSGTHNNVLRAKISQTHPWFTYVLYVWFDGINQSALLKIDDQPSVEYLLSETKPVGIAEFNKQDINVYPNPTTNHILFESDDRGDLVIANNLGQVVFMTSIKDRQSMISTTNLVQGVYHLMFVTRDSITTSQLIIQR